MFVLDYLFAFFFLGAGVSVGSSLPSQRQAFSITLIDSGCLNTGYVSCPVVRPAQIAPDTTKPGSMVESGDEVGYQFRRLVMEQVTEPVE